MKGKAAMPMEMDDKEMHAKMDARDLARAEEIKADPKRLKAAQAAAKKLMSEKRDEMEAMKSATELDKLK